MFIEITVPAAGRKEGRRVSINVHHIVDISEHWEGVDGTTHITVSTPSGSAEDIRTECFVVHEPYDDIKDKIRGVLVAAHNGRYPW